VTKYDKNVSSIVETIRQTAESLKSKKREIGKKATEVIGLVKEPFESFVYYGKALSSFGEAVATVIGVVTRNKEAKEMVETLVGNVAHDVASRLNETASLVEFVAKDPTAAAAIKQSVDAASAYVEFCEKKGKTKKPKKTAN